MLKVDTAPLEGRRNNMGKEELTRVVLADDHEVVRQGLKRLLDRVPEIEVVGEAKNGLQALQSVEELNPDVLLLDIEMPVMDGIEVARRIQQAKIKVRILILSAYDDREYIRALLDIGVSGYLIKGDAPSKIIEAVRGVASGQKGWVSPQVRKKLEKMQEPDFSQNALSKQDLDILQSMAYGHTDAVIEEQLHLSQEEFMAAIQSLLQKIGAQTRKEALDISIRKGLLPRDDQG
jgi:DNA-binding NarL/FixJ family response regulator